MTRYRCPKCHAAVETDIIATVFCTRCGLTMPKQSTATQTQIFTVTDARIDSTPLTDGILPLFQSETTAQAGAAKEVK